MLFDMASRKRKKLWKNKTNEIALRAYFLLDDGQPNPDWIVTRLRDEFPDATECQIFTALASELRGMMDIFIRANGRLIDQSLDAAVDDWANTYNANVNKEYVKRYWQALRLLRSIYYEELMSRDYGDDAENAAHKVLQMFGDTFETGPSSREKLQDSHSAVLRYTPVRIETTIMAFKILFRSNQGNENYREHLAKGIPFISFRYDLNEVATGQLLKDWDDFVAQIV